MADQQGDQLDPLVRPPRTSIDPSQMTGPMVAVADSDERLPWLKWIDRFSTLLAALGGIATAGLMLNVVFDVLSRAAFNRPLQGTLDLTQFAWMPTAVSLGLGYALLRGEHVRVNLLTGPTGPRTQRIIEIASMIFTLFTLALMIWFSVEKAQAAMGFDERAVGTPWLDIWPFRWVIIVGMLGLFLQSVASLLRAIAVAEFRPSDADEAVAALEAEETVFDELEISPNPSDESLTTGKVQTR